MQIGEDYPAIFPRASVLSKPPVRSQTSQLFTYSPLILLMTRILSSIFYIRSKQKHKRILDSWKQELLSKYQEELGSHFQLKFE